MPVPVVSKCRGTCFLQCLGYKIMLKKRIFAFSVEYAERGMCIGDEVYSVPNPPIAE